MVDTCHYTFVQTHRIFNTKSEPDVNYGLEVVMLYQCRFISCNRCTTVLSDIENEGSSACVGAESIWEISMSSSQFCVNLKLL